MQFLLSTIIVICAICSFLADSYIRKLYNERSYIQPHSNKILSLLRLMIAFDTLFILLILIKAFFCFKEHLLISLIFTCIAIVCIFYLIRWIKFFRLYLRYLKQNNIQVNN
jgi:hypothetical protein